MPKMLFFYDYECPYCKLGYEYMVEFIDSRPDIEIEWKPIEAHPRPENHPPHTDLAVQSYYIAKELNADMPKFHAAMFQAASAERRNVEDVEVLVEIVKYIVDANKFREILKSNKYADRVVENNDLAYEKNGVWAVPAFRLDVKKLDAVERVGVTKDQVKEFLNK
jgi:predicted DsbA family dithiol-disulfide isomerase